MAIQISSAAGYGGKVMKAIILAAGLGRRMRPLTDHTHKTLLPIAGTTILHRLLGSLRDCDVRDVCIVTGYRSEDLALAMAHEFSDLNVEFVHNPQYDTTNNVFSMALALETISVDDDILWWSRISSLIPESWSRSCTHVTGMRLWLTSTTRDSMAPW